MKRNTLLLIFVCAAITASAQMITTMNIWRTDGTALYIPLNTIDSITYSVGRDPNCPQIVSVTTAQQEVEGGTNFTIRVVAQSPIPVNWLTICLDSPNGNIYGGGGGAEFTNLGNGLYEYLRTDFISAYMPNGDYYYSCIQVGNSGGYESEYWPAQPKLTITTHTFAADKPTITNVSITQTSTEGGTNLTLSLQALSNVPLMYFSGSLDSPNGNLFGGGGSAEFSVIGENLYEYTRTDFISEWLPNGEYRYYGLTVTNEANLESDPYTGDVSVTITGHQENVSAPTLESVNLSTQKVDGGTQVTLVITATSVAPIDWLNICLDGPNGNIYGGGGDTTFEQLSENKWQYTRIDFIPSDYPAGKYTYSCLSVENAAHLQSAEWLSPLEFTISYTF